MKIEILGMGCAKCNALHENARAAVEKLALEDCTIVKIQDFNEIAKRGVLVTPALLLDGQVKVNGKAASTDEIVNYLQGRKKGID
jgi:small redox-active disulfide protein 2